MHRASLSLLPALLLPALLPSCLPDTAQVAEAGTDTSTTGEPVTVSASQTSASAEPLTTGEAPDDEPVEPVPPDMTSGTGAPPVDPCDPVVFADPALELEVSQLLQLGPGPVPLAAALSVEYLNLYTDVHSLVGLDCFAGLLGLSLSDPSELTDLGPLAALKSLQALALPSGAVSDLAPLAELGALRNLDVSFNPIASLTPLVGVPLTQLSIGGVPPAGLQGLGELVTLEELQASLCDLSSSGPDLAQLVNLRRLNAGAGHIGDLAPLAAMTHLEELLLAGTPVADLSPLAGLPELTNLTLDSTGVADIAPLASLTQLRQLGLTNNAITDITPLAGLAALESLQLEYNPITDLGQYVDMAWRSPKQVYAGNLAVVDLQPLTLFPGLESALLYGNEIVDLTPLLAVPTLRDVNVGDNPLALGLDALATHPGLLHFDAFDAGLLTLPVVAPTRLRSLRLSSNQITDLSPLTAYKLLQDIDLSDNAITTLAPIMNAPWLAGSSLLLYGNPLDAQTFAEFMPQLCQQGVAVYWGEGEAC